MPADAAGRQRFLDSIQAATALDRGRVAELFMRYGSRAGAVAADFAAAGDKPLRHAADHSTAEIRYLCRETAVQHLADLVIRRTLLAIRGHVTPALLAELADIAAAELGWSLARRQDELRACTATLRDRHCVQLPPAEAPRAEPADSVLATGSISNSLTT